LSFNGVDLHTKRKIGIHLRLTHSINDLAAHAESLKLPIFQCFFIHQITNQFVTITDQEIATFLNKWRKKFDELYLHGSYWINLASASTTNRILMRELDLAKKLEFSSIVVHPGSARRTGKKADGVAAIARKLNAIIKKENDITFILENTAHAGHSIGGDLHDFYLLRERLEHPEKIKFCIDTAHAYSYGYDIIQEKDQKHFFELIQKYIGFENLALIHLNDTNQECGSRIDRHEVVGQGKLGPILPEFIHREHLKNIPIIMELPVMDEDKEKKVLEMVKKWEEK
jgi:deoxyribonuclease IV